MSNQSNASNDRPRTVKDVLRTIEIKSSCGGYIYRGERQRHTRVSSNLYREYGIDEEHFDIEIVQTEMVNDAKKHLGELPQDFHVDLAPSRNAPQTDSDETINFEILTEIQHYGGKSNLIDFTTDYLIALFFACDGYHQKDGRVILQRIEEIKNMINYPRNPRHRVIAQKSVFVRPPKGFIQSHDDDIVTIPANLKQAILQHLRTYHGISTETIYNDLYGFIRNQDIHGGAYTRFYKGFAYQKRADEVTTPEEKQEQYKKSIEHYTKAIELKPDLAETYNNRGLVYNKMRKYDDAIADFNTTIELKPNLVEAHYNRGGAYFEKKEYDRAIEDCNRAIRLKPEYHDPYNNRGLAYVKKKDYNRAIEDFNIAIALNPDDAEAYKNRGMTYGRKREFDRAIDDLNKAIDLKPDYAIAHSCRGIAYRKKGNYDRAIENFNKAIGLNLHDANTFYDRGLAYGGKGEIGCAIGDFTKAINLKSDFAEARHNRGVGWLHMQEWGKARADLMTARNMGVDIINEFLSEHASVDDFQEKTGVKLPLDIAAMLTPPQT